MQKMKEKEVKGEETRLTQVSLQSEPVPDGGIYKIVIVRHGAFLLDPFKFRHCGSQRMKLLGELHRNSRCRIH
jgi:hypothetical protein